MGTGWVGMTWNGVEKGVKWRELCEQNKTACSRVEWDDRVRHGTGCNRVGQDGEDGIEWEALEWEGLKWNGLEWDGMRWRGGWNGTE